MNKLVTRAGLGMLLVSTIVSAAHADERWPRWYIGLEGGYTYMSDEDLSGATNAAKIKLNNGWGVGGSIGYLPSSSIPFINSLRFEGEVVYHENDLDQVGYKGGSTVAGNGSFSSTAYMVNAYYDLPLENSPWSPYVGGGIGLADVHLSPTQPGNTSGHDSEFAYQGLAGIGYTAASIPNTQWTLGYRYLATTDPRFSGPTGDIKTSYATHSVELGAKFRF